MEFNKQNTKKILQIIFISIIFYFTLQRFGEVLNSLKFIWEVLFVFFLGGAMAFIFNVPMKKIESHLFTGNKKFDRFRRVVAYLITLTIIILLIYLVLFIVIPELAATLQVLSLQIQQFYEKIPGFIQEFSQKLPELGEYINKLEIDWASLSQNAIKTMQTAFSGVLNSGTWLLMGVISGVTKFIMSLIFSIYLLFSKEKIAAAVKKTAYALFKEKAVDKAVYIARLSNKVFSSFLSGQCMEAVILGCMFFVAMSIFKMPYALLIGVAIAVTALIPIFGAFIGCFLGIFLIVMVNPAQAIWFVVLFLVLQQIEGNVIYPKVVGSSVGLPSILVFIAVIIGGNLMGIAGMLIFIPMCSVLYTLGKDYIDTRLKGKNIPSKKLG
ncbi:MAG: AI-2E family transporter [Oscillospiraceae bacterium]